MTTANEALDRIEATCRKMAALQRQSAINMASQAVAAASATGGATAYQLILHQTQALPTDDAAEGEHLPPTAPFSNPISPKEKTHHDDHDTARPDYRPCRRHRADRRS